MATDEAVDTKNQSQLQLTGSVQAVLATIEREREREIISRRYGLFDRKETLEQIGELLGITRERVRQLEKSVMTRLKQQGTDLPFISEMQSLIKDKLAEHGELMRVLVLSEIISGNHGNKLEQAQVAFLASLCPELIVIDENDYYFQSVGLEKVRGEKAIKAAVEALISTIKELGEPKTIEVIAEKAHFSSVSEAGALAGISKQLASLNGQWGLIKWPTVNPKNIRDKIYVILKENGKHMHFSDIAKAIKGSEFKRRDVTTQAIHNELIKDKRFVLIGRGIYALKEWGYKRGTVADIIGDVLQKAGEPLHRDEIVKRVLKSRYVKETTILLNLQGKPQFKRVAKATYALDQAK